MDVLEREAIANAASMGEYIFSKLADWKQKHPIVGDVRGRGLMIGIEIVKDQKSREMAGAWRDRIVERAFDHGMLILGCGETSIRLSPPLIINQHEADIAVDILETCIGEIEQEHGLSQSSNLAATTA
jgi:4-aminobutyrate aminotransferase